MRPTLFRVPASSDGGIGEPEPWMELDGTPIEYGEGFNLNGIAATGDGQYLITVKSNTGKLYRIDTESKEVAELGGETPTNGDGLLLDDQTLYVVRNQQELIVSIELSEDFASGEVDEGFTDLSFAYPTTIAKHDERLLVVNSQFDRRRRVRDQSCHLPSLTSRFLVFDEPLIPSTWSHQRTMIRKVVGKGE